VNASRFLLPLLIVAALYFLFLRPQKNRQKAAQALSNNIEPGQRIVTTAGMYATVVELDDAGVLLEIAPGVQVRYVRQAISRVVEAELVGETEVGEEYADGEYPEGEYAEGEYPEGEYADGEYAADGDYEGAPEGDGTEDDSEATHSGSGATAVDLSKGSTLSAGALAEHDAADQARR
jgi:preprotein translocase subunit YajC